MLNLRFGWSSTRYLKVTHISAEEISIRWLLEDKSPSSTTAEQTFVSNVLILIIQKSINGLKSRTVTCFLFENENLDWPQMKTLVYLQLVWTTDTINFYIISHFPIRKLLLIFGNRRLQRIKLLINITDSIVNRNRLVWNIHITNHNQR